MFGEFLLHFLHDLSLNVTSPRGIPWLPSNLVWKLLNWMGSLTSIQTLFLYPENTRLKFTFPRPSWSLDPRNDTIFMNKMQGILSVAHKFSILMALSIIFLAWMGARVLWFCRKQFKPWLQHKAAEGSFLIQSLIQWLWRSSNSYFNCFGGWDGSTVSRGRTPSWCCAEVGHCSWEVSLEPALRVLLTIL